jgi:hypothetical protein
VVGPPPLLCLDRHVNLLTGGFRHPERPTKWPEVTIWGYDRLAVPDNDRVASAFSW